MLTVAKFGGSSLATPDAFYQVGHILRQSPDRKICIVSAAGSIGKIGRLGYGEKITDLLIHKKYSECIWRIRSIMRRIGSPHTLQKQAVQVLRQMTAESPDARLSFGEYISARMLASFTNRKFVDAKDVLLFDGNNVTVRTSWDIEEPVVIPGFYGYDTRSNKIRVFPRGGSDITGAIIAKALQADMYENWTDVSGVFSKDPRVHPDAVHYPQLRYCELKTVVENGAQVFHPDAIAPLLGTGIPTVIKNTFRPNDPGTIIV